MNRRPYRTHAIWLLAALAFAATLALATGVPSALVPPGSSPVSPVAAFPWAPTPEPISPWNRVFDESYWTSPLPWVAIGLIAFSALAGVLVRVLQPPQSKRVERAGPPRPPARVP